MWVCECAGDGGMRAGRRLRWVAVGVCLLSLLVPLPAQGVAEAEPGRGPFLRVTALAPAKDGIVFRIGWAHPYRPGGSHRPVAAGHLSRLFTPAPKPVPPSLAPTPPAGDETAEEGKDVRSLRDDDILGGAAGGLDIDVGDFEEPEEKKEEPEQAHGHRHEEPRPKKPERPTELKFDHTAVLWDTAEALFPTNRLRAGEASAALDLDPFLPAPTRQTSAALSADEAVLLYVRAFHGTELAPAPCPVRLELYRKPGDGEPAARIEMTAGFFGIRLNRPRGGSPFFETEHMYRERWYAETRRILSERAGRQFFATADARVKGSGRKDDPVDLQAALSSRMIRGGDTIWLSGGVYEAPGHRVPRPPPEVPPVIAPLSPSNMPKLETTVDLGEDEDTDDDLDLLLEEAFEERMPGQKGDRKKVEPKFVTRYQFRSTIAGDPGNPVIVRAAPGERVILRGGLMISGAHAWYWGFEIGEPSERANSRVLSSVVDVNGPGIRLVNLRIHGHARGPGITTATPMDAEMYGCIVHDQGYWPKISRYTQDFMPPGSLGVTTLGGVFRVTDNIVFGGYGYNLQAPMWSESMHNLVIEGNFLFSAGRKKEDWQAANLAVPWHLPFWRTFITDNVLYQPGNGADNFLSVAHSPLLGWESGELVFRNNIVYGGGRCLEMGLWGSMRVTNNVIAHGKTLVNVVPKLRPPEGMVWDRNTYISRREPSDTNAPALMQIWGHRTSFDGWRKILELDRNSVFQVDRDDLPPRVVVRPNRYEPGRVHVAVIGWGKVREAAVDLGGVFEKGAAFAAYNVEDLERAVAEGVFDGEPVSLPRSDSALTPDFDAYLVRSTVSR